MNDTDEKPREGANEPSESTGTEERPIDPILTNALAEVLVDGPAVLADDESRAIVRETAESVTTPEERAAFGEAVGAVHEEGTAGDEARTAAVSVVDPVRAALADRGARVTVDHETPVPVDEETAAVYNFARHREPEALTALDLSPSVASHVETGAEKVAAGEYDAAAAAFTRAVEAAGTGDDAVTTRTLAAWAHHWAGDDHGAIDFVEEALHLHADAWLPKLAGHSADPDPSYARPQQFRDGKYAAMAVLRYTVDRPPGTELTPYLGVGDEDGDGREWVELEGPDDCTPVHRLGPEPVLRLRFSGDVPAFPAVHGYYVGLGVVDLEVAELREVFRLLVDGPLGEAVTETIHVEVLD